MEKLPFGVDLGVQTGQHVSIFSGLPLVEKLRRGFFVWKALYSGSFRGIYVLLPYFYIEIVT